MEMLWRDPSPRWCLHETSFSNHGSERKVICPKTHSQRVAEKGFELRSPGSKPSTPEPALEDISDFK
jgi:hypothetical protein